MTWFPYDLQNCTMKFGAWSYTGFYVDLRQLPYGYLLCTFSRFEILADLKSKLRGQNGHMLCLSASTKYKSLVHPFMCYIQGFHLVPYDMQSMHAVRDLHLRKCKCKSRCTRARRRCMRLHCNSACNALKCKRKFQIEYDAADLYF